MSRIIRLAEMYHHPDSDTDDDAFTTTVAGAALVIPVTHLYVAKTTGGAEACTLADGKPGQVLILNLTVQAGAVTLTPATMTGFATIVLTAAGDTCVLLYVDDTVGWVILGLYGAAATPVVSV